MPKDEIIEYYDKYKFRFSNQCQEVFQFFTLIYTWEFPLVLIHSNTCYLYNSILAFLMDISRYLIVVLTYSSLFIKKVEHLFVCLLTFWVSSLMKWSLLPIFPLGDLIYDFFMYFRCKLCLLYVVNIFSHFSATFFILVRVPFDGVQFLALCF